MKDRRCISILAVAAAVILASSPAFPETLRIVTVDSATGKPLPARVSVRPAGKEWISARDSAGKPFAPQGLPRLWSQGSIAVEVPPGKAEAIASRPFAHLPAAAEVEVRAGGETEVKLELRPLVDLPALGWYGGDAHTHVVHGEREVNADLRVAAAISRAEGLDWAAFGEVWASEGRQPTPAERTALCKELTDDLFLAAWTQEYPKDHLGHMACFPTGLEREVEDAAGANRYETTPERRESFAHFEMVRSLQALGALSVYTHPTREYGGTAESPSNIARELPFDAVAAPWALEGLDVLTDVPWGDSDLRLWYFLLDRGFRLPAFGFSDTCYDRKGEGPGDTRTYVALAGRPRTMPAIVAAARGGRTFATSGPLVLFTVDGSPASAVFPPGGESRKARVRAWNAVDHQDPRKPAFIARILAIRNGKPWKESKPPAETRAWEWDFEIQEAGDAWYAIRVDGSSNRQIAVTSPVYFEGKDRRPPQPAAARVRGKVTGKGGAPLEGKVLAVEHGKDYQKVVAEARVSQGAYEIRCPAACRIRVEAEGHEPGLKSIFLDCDRIYRELFWPIRRDRLMDPSFYREIEKRLEDAVLDFELKPAPGR